MFTGIVEKQGIVELKQGRAKQTRFRFRFDGRVRSIALGESIAVNGVCLTVREAKGSAFEADVVGETLRATNLDDLKEGSRVNLERSLRAGDSIGGHFVSGHVDCCGKVAEIRQSGKDCYFTVAVPPALHPFIAVKGSIAIDGVSLTIQKISNCGLTVTLVPHTLKVTTLGSRRKGDRVNLEADLMARYMVAAAAKTEQRKQRGRLDVQKLRAQGF